MDALEYISTSIVTILVLASYLLLLSIFHHAFQAFLSAGILGPLVLGAIYARPLANILLPDVQSAVLAIGYLGLILLIVQGGLDARIDILSSPRNLAISALVGATGVVFPIGISMALLPAGFGYDYLESFAVGAALASTSLGTTFAVLGSFNKSSETPGSGEDSTNADDAKHGIADTRIGAILIGAALLDDVVGLVIFSVISTLGPAQQGGLSAIRPWKIARPIVASALLLIVSWLLARFALGPIARLLASRFAHSSSSHSIAQHLSTGSTTTVAGKIKTRLLRDRAAQQLLAVTLLVSTVLAYSVISEEIGSSLLIGAFSSGATMKYVYTCFTRHDSDPRGASDRHRDSPWSPDYLVSASTPLGTVQDVILVPFFFSSIGSAIPVKSMFDGTTVWRGIIFAGLMAFAKVCTGGWVHVADWIELRVTRRACQKERQKQGQAGVDAAGGNGPVDVANPIEMQQGNNGTFRSIIINDRVAAADLGTEDYSRTDFVESAPVWPASLFLGTALMSRGEIGFLVINIAYQGGLLSEQAFNVGIWAIVLNTLVGPVSIGTLMRTQHGQNLLLRGTSSITHGGRWT
ncbi:uncharacterized protein SPSC_04442 [Sporisorium scitamineum]|uniref:Cation/H+ exchanger transmembrane domain-containing protein n=1 Tax=Sporisorium scitamineum TaxID=49012 RepID=A0A0F7RVT0_9BASI|nr:hypothetical protein [Sporisorium scitamineum]CDU24609.1 uncharacterized protein SPSC_04442 [Sporisorium scitamineum]